MKKLFLLVNAQDGSFTDWAGSAIDTVGVVHNDDVLLCFHIREPDASGVMQDLNLSAAASLALGCKSGRQDAGTDYGIVTAYNQGDYPAGEDLSVGKFTMVFPFTATAIDTALGTTFEAAAAWMEISTVINSRAQTLGQVRAEIVQELGVTGGTPPTSPTYYTAAESDALYQTKARHAALAISTVLVAADLANGEKVFPIDAVATITLPAPSTLAAKGYAELIFKNRASFSLTFDVTGSAVIKSKLTPAGSASVVFALGAYTVIRIELESPESPTTSDYVIYTTVTP